MSLGARATKGGAKTGKEKSQDKGKPDKPQPKEKVKPQTRSAQDKDKPQPKEKVKPQATTEQIRMANMIDRKSDDATEVRKMVNELMEMTRRSEEEVCSALHDSDNDLVAACNLLLEDTQRIQGEWQTNEKKKKNKQPAGGNGEAEPPRDPDPRSRSGPRPRRGEGEGGRGRGSGRGRGGARGATRGGRGGRGGRAPPRRALRTSEPGWETNDSGVGISSEFPQTEDWDNEEWSGSTKVFTPSTSAQPDQLSTNNAKQEDWDSPEANGPLESIPTYTYHSSLAPPPPAPAPHPAHTPQPPAAAPAPSAAQQGAPTIHRSEQITTANNLAYSEAPPLDSYRTTPHHQPMGMSGTLTAAQSQYLSQLTAGSAYAHVVPQPHTAHSAHAAHTAHTAHTEQRNKQRARVPPPSKIPSTAVEMPGGGGEGAMFLDVQFGALEPDALDPAPPAPAPSAPSLPAQPAQHAQHAQPAAAQHQANMVTQHHNATKQQVHQPEPAAVSAASHSPEPSHSTHQTHSTHTHQSPANSYQNANSMLSESLSVVDTTPSSQQPASQADSIVTNTTSSLEKQLSQGMKQLSVSSNDASSMQQYAQQPQQSHHRPKQQQQQQQQQQSVTQQQQNVYAHHAVSHHPPVYGANVYAPQVNSSNASLTAASGITQTQYPSSVTLTQYQPINNLYQQTSSSATVYGGSALYTAAAAAAAGVAGVAPPYTAYQPAMPKLQPKDNQQYDSSVSSSNSLTNTSTTQTATAKVATTTVSAAGGSNTGSNVGASTYAAGALYTAGTNATYAAYDEQMMRSTLPHHMGGYYEVGYGVGGVTGAREGTFGLGAGERFGRADAASPQQVPAAALPPGYAYFYQPPPTTYQYGVYPTYGGGSNVGGVGGVGGVSGGGAGKLSTYAPQQPPYDAQDSYKQAGPYTGNTAKSGGGATADLTNAAMYAKTHVALNKVNSYEKAAFHSGTPPPFGAGSHLYIPAPPHHHPHHHAPQHQMDARVSSSHNRRESGSGGGRANAAKPASKPTYSQSYWAPN